MKERTVQQVWLYNSGATAFQFSRLFALQRKFKPRSQQGHPPPGIPQIFRDKLVCHSLVVFTIRLNLPGQSHQNPMGRGKNRKTHTLQWVLAQEQEFLRKHRAHSLWTMVQAQEKIVFFFNLSFYSLHPLPSCFFCLGLWSKEQLWSDFVWRTEISPLRPFITSRLIPACLD